MATSKQNKDLGSRVGVAVLLLPIVVGCLLVPSLWLALLWLGWMAITIELVDACQLRCKEARIACALQWVIGTLGLIAASLLRNSAEGVAWVLLPLVSVIATDTIAYFGGRQFGTPGTFFPQFSPNKSWQGAYLGIVGGMLVGGSAVLAITAFEGNFPVMPGLVAAFLVPVFAVAGDLLESRAKRLCEMKDFTIGGKPLLRAHGGVNDRVDALVVGWICTCLVVMISGNL